MADDASATARYVDIGANLLDERFTRGSYRGKIRHLPDLDEVIQRAVERGVHHVVLTAGTLEESREAVRMTRALNHRHVASGNDNDGSKTLSPSSLSSSCQFHCTVGVHPTRCSEFLNSPRQRLESLLEVAKDGASDGTVVAVGEMGLDYDRLQFCPKDVQQLYFEQQLLVLADETRLPLFLHNRNVGTDVYDILARNVDKWQSGGAVVHSFDDTIELANKFLTLNDNVYIGLNGCSLRTAENLEVVRQLPLDRILLETDCPYCDVKRTHAGYPFVTTFFETRAEKKCVPNETPGCCVKGRNEPCHIVQVAQVIAGVRGMPVEDLAAACYENSLRLYRWKE